MSAYDASPARKAAVAESLRRLRARRREFLYALKDKPCADCGIKYPPYVMDFDHRDPSTKRIALGGAVSSGKFNETEILKEVAKCDVVCANCHRIRTHRLHMAARKPFSEPAARTHCANGHPYTEENTRIRRNGWRVCRACERAYQSRRATAAGIE